MPISILTGRADVMQLLEKEEYFLLTPEGRKTLSLAATKATLNEIIEKIFQVLDRQGKVRRI